MNKVSSAWILFHVKEILSPFLLMNLHIVCTNKLLNGHFSETSRSNRMMAAIFKYPLTQRDCILYVRTYVHLLSSL